MIIGLYSDPHISLTSSIMPLNGRDKYTSRLDMIIDSYKWMYEEFEKFGVDLICNCGDTFDSHTVKAEEITALSECLSFSRGTPEIWITGNHEIYNSKFSSNYFVGDYDFITLYDKITKVDDTISVIPYMKASDIDVSILPEIANKVVLSHIDIKGSHLRPDFIDDSGFDPEYLSMYFEASFNGHIHSSETIDTTENPVYNIGSIVSHSFSDSPNHHPSIWIYNTESKKMTRLINPHAILFRKFDNVESVTDLLKIIKDLGENFKYILRIGCPYELKEDVKDIISRYENIIASRIITSIREGIRIDNRLTEEIIINNNAVHKKFKSFLEDNQDILKYPANIYDKVISDLEERSDS